MAMGTRQAAIIGLSILIGAVALMGILNATDAGDGIAVAAVSVFAVAIGTAIGILVERGEGRQGRHRPALRRPHTT